MKTLTKEFGVLQVTFDGGSYIIDPNGTGEGWRQIGGANFINDTYFDLAGMTINDETLFFQGATVQEVLSPQFAPATAGDNMFLVDIMSKIPLTDSEVQQFATLGNIPGFNGPPITFDQTIYGRVRFMNIDIDNAAGQLTIPVCDNQLGSLSASASDRIYCYRFAAANMNQPGFFNVWGARYILRAEAKEEAEYQYLMRLKRSYELQNEPDRD